MTTDTADKLIWTLIYGGLLLASLGIFVRRDHEPIGWTIIALGALATTVGAVLVYVRSRMKDGAVATESTPRRTP